MMNSIYADIISNFFRELSRSCGNDENSFIKFSFASCLYKLNQNNDTSFLFYSGNTYHIQNLGNEDVELVFTQLKTTAK